MREIVLLVEVKFVTGSRGDAWNSYSDLMERKPSFWRSLDSQEVRRVSGSLADERFDEREKPIMEFWVDERRLVQILKATREDRGCDTSGVSEKRDETQSKNDVRTNERVRVREKYEGGTKAGKVKT